MSDGTNLDLSLNNIWKNIILCCLYKLVVLFCAEFIRPVCLPFGGDNKEMEAKVWLKLTGWGFLDEEAGN